MHRQANQHDAIVVVRNDASGLTREGLNIELADLADKVDLVTLDLRVEPAERLTDLLEAAPGPVFVVLSLPLAPGAIPFNVDFDETPYCRSAATFYKPDQYNYIGVYRCGIPGLAEDNNS